MRRYGGSRATPGFDSIDPEIPPGMNERPEGAPGGFRSIPEEEEEDSDSPLNCRQDWDDSDSNFSD